VESTLLTAIIDFLPDAIFVIDGGGHVIAWNRVIEIMTGVSRKDMLGKGGDAHVIPFYCKRRFILINLIMHEGKESEASYDYAKKRRKYHLCGDLCSCF
jgi:PAS domain S-box-containing protein